MAEPGPHAAENTRPGEAGRVFGEYCNRARTPEFEAVARGLRSVARSQLWPKPVPSTRWRSEEDFQPDAEAYMPVPDRDAEGLDAADGRWRPAPRRL